MTTLENAEPTPLADPRNPRDPEGIHRALEALRLDPAGFRAGVERRIAEREKRAEDQRARAMVRPSIWIGWMS